jgi:hypothetical protein
VEPGRVDLILTFQQLFFESVSLGLRLNMGHVDDSLEDEEILALAEFPYNVCVHGKLTKYSDNSL